MLRRDLSFRFLPEKRYAEDYLLWLSIVLNSRPAHVLNMPMAYTYKQEFGEGGLTGDLWKTQKGVIDTFQRIYNAGLISRLVFIFISSFSYLKYSRRWVLIKWRIKKES